MSDCKLIVPDNPIVPFIEGDGSGPDIWRAARAVLDTAVMKAYGGRRALAWMEVYAGEKANALYGSYLPDETLSALRTCVVGIKGPLATPVGGGIRSLNVALRKELDLYACVRPVRYYPGTPSPMTRPGLVDMVVFRENTEDVYAGLEWAAGTSGAREIISLLNGRLGACVRPDSAIGVKPVSELGSKRIMRKALEFAVSGKRKSVTVMHKGNIMKYTEGAFRAWAYEVAASEFALNIVLESELDRENRRRGRVIVKDRIADNMFQQVLLKPASYDVIVAMNLNGDYLSDALAAQVGGLGMAPGANLGDYNALFEATHGTAQKYAGTDRMNPGSLILSGAMLLDYIGWPEAAELVRSAIGRTIARGIMTCDLARFVRGSREYKTSEFANAVCGEIGNAQR